MFREKCQIGMKVIFGRENGERTTGVVIKMNPLKAKVKILEQRGTGRGSVVGSVWTVPYSMMEPATPSQEPYEPLTYNPFMMPSDQHIIEAISSTYSELSPENLSCDGELADHEVSRKRSRLQDKLHHLQQALGRKVSECDAFDWVQSRTKAMRSH